MRALSKPLANLEWTDVQGFCERRLTEGARLDYKQDFPRTLEKTVAAMANTLGGTILIGVAEDAEAKPLLPVSGIKFERGLAERIISISAENITPPVVPGVQVCVDANGQRAIVVVEVPQSPDAPHAIESNMQVYVRTGQRNDPDALANLDRLVWMLDARKKSVEFREFLLRRAQQRFAIACAGHVPQIEKSRGWHQNAAEKSELPCLLSVSLVPTYPSAEPLSLPAALQSQVHRIVVADPMGTSSAFPFREVAPRLVEDGIVIHIGKTERTYHTHVNIHGLYLHVQSLLYETTNKETGAKQRAMRFTEIVRRTWSMIESAAKLYSELNYFGPLHARIRLERIIGYALSTPDRDGWGNYERYSADPEIDAIEPTSTDELGSNIASLTHRLVRRIGWAFDSDFSEADVQNAMKR